MDNKTNYNWFRGKPFFDYEKCITCTACESICPSNAIKFELSEDKIKLIKKFHYNICMFCGLCKDICPTNAILLFSEYKVKTNLYNDDLYETYKFDVECCKKCKKPFTTKRLIAHNTKFLKNVEYLNICPECRKNIAIENSTKYFKK
jgi:formate hydrogenlyase subunit 6/NADH:ubiquinone oxidoreductase subunit I